MDRAQGNTRRYILGSVENQQAKKKVPGYPESWQEEPQPLCTLKHGELIMPHCTQPTNTKLHPGLLQNDPQLASDRTFLEMITSWLPLLQANSADIECCEFL